MAPRLPITVGATDEHGATDATGMTPAFSAAREGTLEALARLDRIDQVTHELCRLLNAELQQCRVCLRYRYTDAGEELLGDVTHYENSEHYDERQKLALRLCDVYLRSPGLPDPDLRAALLAEFAPEEILELLLRQVRYTWNKVLVTLGLDGD